MAWFIGQSAVMIVLAFMLGVLACWLLLSRGEAHGARVTTHAAPVGRIAVGPEPARPPDRRQSPLGAPAASEAGSSPRLDSSPRPASPERGLDQIGPRRSDNLQEVEGVGPRISGALHAAGIHTFEDLAGCDPARLQAALDASGLRLAPNMATWAEQARLLAARRP